MTLADLTPPGRCGCGCGALVARRFVKGHQALPVVETAGGCWIWTGKRDAGGYGRLRRAGRDWLAHRWVYERLVGGLDPLAVMDHLCRNRSCVNPAHLEPTTDAVNVRRGRCARLAESDVVWLREKAATFTGSQRTFAREQAPAFGVAESTIRNALCGATWGEPKGRVA